jgi:hypothetical protein
MPAKMLALSIKLFRQSYYRIDWPKRKVTNWYGRRSIASIGIAQ